MVSNDGDVAVKQAVSVYFKNWVHKQWTPLEGASPISPADKQNIRTHILSAMVQVPKMRKMFAGILYYIVRADFPKELPTLVSDIGQLLQSQDSNGISSALLALYQVLSFKGYEDDGLYDQIVKSTFPLVLKVGNVCVGSDDEQALEILKVILKIYYTVILYALPEYVSDSSIFYPWFSFIVKTFEKKEPKSLQSLEVEERSDHVFWKLKKWAIQIFNRLLSRYGNVTCDPSNVTEFSKIFLMNFAPGLCKVMLQMVADHSSNPTQFFLSERVICLTCDFFVPCVKSKVAWPIIKPHAQSIINEFIFPKCCFTDEDQELWEDNPYEYVHARLDPYEEYYSVTASASNLLLELIKGRKKITLTPTLGFLNEVLTCYLSKPTEDMARKKDGALYIIGYLENVIMKTDIASQMEMFMKTHVLPELKSSFPFIRARACWMLQHFGNLEYTNQNDPIGIFNLIIENLQHKDLAVRIEAAISIGSLMDYDQVKQVMIPVLPNIMQGNCP